MLRRTRELAALSTTCTHEQTRQMDICELETLVNDNKIADYKENAHGKSR